MLTELRLALRTLVKQPGPSLVVVFTLGLALGANAAIFPTIDALALRPFPFRDATDSCTNPPSIGWRLSPRPIPAPRRGRHPSP